MRAMVDALRLLLLPEVIAALIALVTALATGFVTIWRSVNPTKPYKGVTNTDLKELILDGHRDLIILRRDITTLVDHMEDKK